MNDMIFTKEFTDAVFDVGNYAYRAYSNVGIYFTKKLQELFALANTEKDTCTAYDIFISQIPTEWKSSFQVSYNIVKYNSLSLMIISVTCKLFNVNMVKTVTVKTEED